MSRRSPIEPVSNDSGSLCISGAAGFIGTALRERLGPYPRVRVIGIDLRPQTNFPGHESLTLDVRRPGKWKGEKPSTLIHLAALAEAVVPWALTHDMFSVNLGGTWSILQCLQPRKVIFASTCAVYGDVLHAAAKPSWRRVRPVGVYGASKAAGELMLRDWARETGGSAIILRFGNVIGPRCRGLIRYLVRHALDHPDGNEPARMRGFGRVERDYVPVEHIVEVMLESAAREWPPGSVSIFNVGAGRTMTNGAVAKLVKRRLGQHGFPLAIRFDDPLAPGEAERSALDVSRTGKFFGLAPPGIPQVRLSIVDSVDSLLI